MKGEEGGSVWRGGGLCVCVFSFWDFRFFMGFLICSRDLLECVVVVVGFVRCDLGGI